MKPIWIHIFLRSQVPESWPENQKITYKICYQVIRGCEKHVDVLQASSYEAIKKAVKCLDPSVNAFPSSKKFSNFRKRVSSIKNSGSDEVIDELYLMKKEGGWSLL